MSKNIEEYILDAARAHTAISLLAAAQELLEQSNRDSRVSSIEVGKLVKKIKKLRQDALQDLDVATAMILDA